MKIENSDTRQLQKINSLAPPGQLVALERISGISVPPDQKELIKSALMPKLKELSEMGVVERLITILVNAYTISGQKPEIETLVIYANEFYNELMRRYPNVTIEEVAQAVNNGVYGEYGEYFGLNLKTFIFFVKSYLFDGKRVSALNGYHRSAPVPFEIEMTDEEKDRDNRDFVNYLFSLHVSGKLQPELIPVHIYEFLLSAGHINLSKEEKQKVYSYALKRIENWLFRTYMSVDECGSLAKTMSRQLCVFNFLEAARKEDKSKIF